MKLIRALTTVIHSRHNGSCVSFELTPVATLRTTHLNRLSTNNPSTLFCLGVAGAFTCLYVRCVWLAALEDVFNQGPRL